MRSFPISAKWLASGSAWKRKPDFVFALGVDDQDAAVQRAFRFEVWDNELVALGESERDADVASKIEEEIEEWREAAARGDRGAEEKEIGDLLLSAVNLARRRSVDPEAALRGTNRRFRSRFAGVARRAALSGRPISEIPLTDLDAYWEEAKNESTED